MDKDHFRQVLRQSPFHSRLEEHNLLKNWASWNGYLTPRLLDTKASEYFAIRSSCSVMDLTPMEKYRISGPDALKFLNRLVTRDVSRLQQSRVSYVLWCNDEGKVLDDGTLFRLGENEYRLCSMHHQLDWLMLSSLGMDVAVEKQTDDIAALAVQGPTSCSVLMEAGIGNLHQLKPFHFVHSRINDLEVMISRTGFTGDLGYELWTDPASAPALWDALFEVKKLGLYDIRAIGLDALNMVRIEAGFLIPGDDFNPADSAIRADHVRSPFELGLGWAVNFDKPHFTGKRALIDEKQGLPGRRIVRLVVNGNKDCADSFLYNARQGRRIGTIKSCTWSPILKSNLALADVEYDNGIAPKTIWAEVYYQKELEWRSNWVQCEISEKPFWRHERRLKTPPARF
ncbi:MAG: aminomethyltransferase family protein [Gammaproteobacteria bacterium]|jgi:aminomethyltransferase